MGEEGSEGVRGVLGRDSVERRRRAAWKCQLTVRKQRQGNGFISPAGPTPAILALLFLYLKGLVVPSNCAGLSRKTEEKNSVPGVSLAGRRGGHGSTGLMGSDSHMDDMALESEKRCSAELGVSTIILGACSCGGSGRLLKKSETKISTGVGLYI